MKTFFKITIIVSVLILALKSVSLCRTVYADLQQRYTSEARGKALGFIMNEITE